MSIVVPQAASAFDFGGVRTGQPVSTATLARLADELAHVTGHLLHKAGEAIVHPRPAGRTTLEGLAHTVWVPYTRSPGAQAIRVLVELHDSEEIGDSQTVTATLPSGASWIDAGGLDGATTLYNPPAGRTCPRELVGWADVSGVTAGTLTDVIQLAVTPSSKSAGVKRATVHEVPLASLAIDATEPGWDSAATRAGRLVVDGGSSSPRGMQRVWHCLDQGRSGFRQHWCLSDIETADATAYGTTPHWSREANTLGTIDWLQSASATDPCWYLQVRDLYDGAAGAVWKLRSRYRTSNGTTCKLRLYYQGGALASGAWTGAGAESYVDVTLTGTSGTWTWTTGAAVTLPTDGTDGLVRVRFEAQGPGAGQLLALACIDLRENES